MFTDFFFSSLKLQTVYPSNKLITKINDTTNIILIFARLWNLVPQLNGRTQAGSVLIE